MKAFKTYVAVINAKNEQYEVKYWSRYPPNSKGNIEDAGKAYIASAPFFTGGTVKVVSTKRISYREYKERHTFEKIV